MYVIMLYCYNYNQLRNGLMFLVNETSYILYISDMFSMTIFWLFILLLMLVFNSTFVFWFLSCFFYLIIVVWKRSRKKNLLLCLWLIHVEILIKVIVLFTFQFEFSETISLIRRGLKQESLFCSLSSIPSSLFMQRLNCNSLLYTPICVAGHIKKQSVTQITR